MLFQLLTQSQRALSNIHTHLSSLDRNALTQFPKAEVRLFYGTALKRNCNRRKRKKEFFYGSHSNPVPILTLVPSQKSLREVQQILNSTEGNFHQLVALLNCRGLNKVKKEKAVKAANANGPLVIVQFPAGLFLCLQDYIDSLKGLCYDGMEGLLYLSLFSFLSALAFTAILCSLPGAWRSFPR